MSKMICVNCEMELKPKENGVLVAEMFQKDSQIYKLWEADLWSCPKCGHKIVSGFGYNPTHEHFNSDIKEIVNKAIDSGRTIIYDYEEINSH